LGWKQVEIAGLMGLTKQAIGQKVNQIQELGFTLLSAFKAGGSGAVGTDLECKKGSIYENSHF